MLRRNLRRMRRYPADFFIAGIPVVFLLLFVYVFGGTLGAGLGGVAAAGRPIHRLRHARDPADHRRRRGQGTAIAVAMDMTEGIIARFRTMAISRASVLAGHVIGSVIQTMLALVIVIGRRACSSGSGRRPGRSNGSRRPGLLALTALAITWLSVALGMVSESVESASNLPMPRVLPFFGSGFVPTESMPDGLRLFADNQPFTPMIETLRGLLLGTPIGNSGVLAVAWCVVITVAGLRLGDAAVRPHSAR